LQPWIALVILPLFAFANAGVSLAGLTLAKLLAPVPLGIVAGLVIGKPRGILDCQLAGAGGRLGTEAHRRPPGNSFWVLAGSAVSALP
jgi:NhaA family Na+:H+ antiporter